MSDDSDDEYRSGIDRMDHPLSHIAATVGAVALIVLIGCLSLLLSDAKILRSTTWWSVAFVSAAMVSVCLIGYFRPKSRVIYVPVLIAGAVSFGVCIFCLAWMLHPDSGTNSVGALLRAILVFCAWLGWAGSTLMHLWLRRK